MKIFLRILALLILVISSLTSSNLVSAVPPPAQTFYGNVTLDGSPAPDGTNVTAQMNGRTAGSDSTSGGEYSLIIQTIEGDQAGDSITFFVDGLNAGSTTLNPGAITPRNLSANHPPIQYTLTINRNGSGSTSGAGTYDEGTVVNISASPASGWQFDNWSGNIGTIANVNDPTTTITMNSNYTITANFSESPEGENTLTIAVNGNGTTIPAVGSHNYPIGAVIDIKAYPDTGWKFVNWSGSTGTIADVNDPTTTITMNKDYTITANFAEVEADECTLTMAVNGNGTTIPEVGSHIYTLGEVVNITAIPDEGWQFDSWTGDVADPSSASTNITMDSDKTVTANFSEVVVEPPEEYTLTMAVNGNGTTTPAVGSHTYEEGTVVNINAIPASGWQFDNWSGGVSQPNSASTTVTMDSDKTVTANFSHIAEEYTLTMAVNGNGATTPAVGSHTYEEGTVVNINATPDDYWQFDGWTGDVADPSSDSTTVTIDSDKTVTANFSQTEDTTPPSITNISASNISKTSADIIWTTDEPSDSRVEFWASPGQLTPLDETLVTEHLVHLTGLTPATTYHYRVMSKDWAGNLTTTGESSFTTLGLPATFITGDWDISLTDTDTGKQVAISFSVANVGDLAGSYHISLEINDEVEATKEGSLNVGDSETLSFSITRDEAGAYQLVIDGLTLSFTVGEASSPSSPIWLLIIGIVIGLAILAVPLVLLVRKRRLEDRSMPGSLFLGEIEPEAEIEPGPAAEERASREAEEYPRREAIEVKESGRSLKVTAQAAEKLKEALLSKTADPEVGFRLITSPLKSNQLKMTLDTAKEGDQVMEKDGIKILILAPEIVAALEGMVMDYQETDEGGGFSISELTSDT